MSAKKQTVTPTEFVLDLDGTFQWPVAVHVPSATQIGKKIKTEFTAEYKHVDMERRREILREYREATKARIDNEAAGVESDDSTELLFTVSQRVLDEVLVGFSRVRDRNKEPVPFTPENKMAMIHHQMVYPSLMRSYTEAISGQDSRGN